MPKESTAFDFHYHELIIIVSTIKIYMEEWKAFQYVYQYMDSIKKANSRFQ